MGVLGHQLGGAPGHLLGGGSLLRRRALHLQLPAGALPFFVTICVTSTPAGQLDRCSTISRSIQNCRPASELSKLCMVLHARLHSQVILLGYRHPCAGCKRSPLEAFPCCWAASGGLLTCWEILKLLRVCAAIADGGAGGGGAGAAAGGARHGGHGHHPGGCIISHLRQAGGRPAQVKLQKCGYVRNLGSVHRYMSGMPQSGPVAIGTDKQHLSQASGCNSWNQCSIGQLPDVQMMPPVLQPIGQIYGLPCIVISRLQHL
jgi:hypothetical protein